MRSEIDIWKTPRMSSERSPFRAMRKMEKEMNRLFESFFETPWSPTQAIEEIEFAPAADVQESDSHYLLSFDVPGVPKENLSVEVVGNQLRVSGERKQERKEEDPGGYISEKSYGHFERTLTLPSEVDPKTLEANYENGVLCIAVPKMETSKRQKIQIGETKPGWLGKFLGKGEEKKTEPEKKVRAA